MLNESCPRCGSCSVVLKHNYPSGISTIECFNCHYCDIWDRPPLLSEELRMQQPKRPVRNWEEGRIWIGKTIDLKQPRVSLKITGATDHEFIAGDLRVLYKIAFEAWRCEGELIGMDPYRPITWADMSEGPVHARVRNNKNEPWKNITVVGMKYTIDMDKAYIARPDSLEKYKDGITEIFNYAEILERV